MRQRAVFSSYVSETRQNSFLAGYQDGGIGVNRVRKTVDPSRGMKIGPRKTRVRLFPFKSPG